MSTDGTSQTPEEIEADIARQRDQLAETVGELQARLDVKTRAKDKASEIRDKATTDDGKPRPEVLGAAAGVVVLLVVLGVLIWRRRD